MYLEDAKKNKEPMQICEIDGDELDDYLENYGWYSSLFRLSEDDKYIYFYDKEEMF